MSLYRQLQDASQTDTAVGMQLWFKPDGAAGSFMTRGKGNPDSWYSCSHGAGRSMSRTRARAQIKQVSFLTCCMAMLVCKGEQGLCSGPHQAGKCHLLVVAMGIHGLQQPPDLQPR